jgi:hypothetical protein
MIAVEVKAAATPSAADARHLEWFAERVGSAFAAGIILHAGPASSDLPNGSSPYQSPASGHSK